MPYPKNNNNHINKTNNKPDPKQNKNNQQQQLVFESNISLYANLSVHDVRSVFCDSQPRARDLSNSYLCHDGKQEKNPYKKHFS